LLAICAAVTGAGAGAAMGYALGLPASAAIPVNLFLLVPVMIVASIFFRQAAHMAIGRTIEDANYRYRSTVLSTLQRLDLRTMEVLGAARLQFDVADGPHKISNTANQIGKVLTLFARLTCSVLILFVLAPSALVALVAVLAVLALSQLGTLRPAMSGQDRARAAEASFFQGLDQLIRGFKQLKLNQEAETDFTHESLDQPARIAQTHKTESGRWLALNFVLCNTAKLSAVAVALYLLSGFVQESSFDPGLMAAVAVIALIPVSTLQEGPVLIRAFAALADQKRNIINLKQAATTRASSREQTEPEGASARELQPFRVLHAAELTYQFAREGGQQGFVVGPISFSIPAGTITFIVGGNGSGKTTLFKLMNGLYLPTSGRTTINDLAVTPAVRRRYCASVFADPFLFRRLYGMEIANPDTVSHVLAQMRLDHVTGYANGGFTNLKLSTGQRKRLALAVALLTQRPLLFLDEFAADQDPEFRDHYYRVLLPHMRDEGRTIVAITHDDSYFNTADRILRMENGRIVEDKAA